MVYSRQRKNTNKSNRRSNRNKETFSLYYNNNNNNNYNNKNDINLDSPHNRMQRRLQVRGSNG